MSKFCKNMDKFKIRLKELRIEKMKATNKEKYGVAFPMQSKEIKQI